MNHQEIFDKVWDHFIVKRNPPSLAEDTEALRSGAVQCLYRGPNGERCAIGLLIPDEVYTPNMEKASIGDLIDSGTSHIPGEERAKLFDLFDGVDFEFLADIQNAHDDQLRYLYDPDTFHVRMAENLRFVAHRWGLTHYTMPTS